LKEDQAGFVSTLSRKAFALRLAFLALISCIIFLKSDNSSAVQGSDFPDKSTFFGSLMSRIFSDIEINLKVQYLLYGNFGEE